MHHGDGGSDDGDGGHGSSEHQHGGEDQELGLTGGQLALQLALDRNGEGGGGGDDGDLEHEHGCGGVHDCDEPRSLWRAQPEAVLSPQPLA